MSETIKTGYPFIDSVFKGFEPGSLTLLSGIPGGGKTTALLNLSNQNFLDGKKVLAITLETPIDQWRRRILSINTKIPYADLANGFLNYTEKQIKNARQKIEEYCNSNDKNYKIFFLTANALTWRQIVEEVEQMFTDFEPDIIYVDQLSLINKECYKKNRETEALCTLVQDIRAYARLKQTRIVAGVHAKSSVVSKKEDGSKKIDLVTGIFEGSGYFLAYADNILGFHIEDNSKCVFDIIKQKGGECGVWMDFVSECGLVVDPSKDLFS